jgi:hypothetical protein
MELPDVDATVERIESLVAEQPETAELVQLLMQLYGAGLARIVEISAEASPELLESLASDKLVGSLLLLHELHPEDAGTRLRRALARVERGLESGRVLLERIDNGTATIRVEHNGGSHLPPHLAAWIENAAFEAAPELEMVAVEGVPAAAGALVQIAPAGSL